MKWLQTQDGFAAFIFMVFAVCFNGDRKSCRVLAATVATVKKESRKKKA
jgi:hypothetical protein